MLGLALEGGGARGAYHIGVIKALAENGYEFDGCVGSSIGAVNACLYAQGDFDTAVRLWGELSSEMLFDADFDSLFNAGEIKLSMTYIANFRKAVKKAIDGRGIDTSKMKALLNVHIDEEKLRKSGRDYGLVTVSITQRKTMELFAEDIPEGLLVNYIMASSSFPGFKPEIIGESSFLDGGIYNNCPINMLLTKGYDNIIAIRTLAPGRYRRVTEKAARGADIMVIEPTENLGNILTFTREQIDFNMEAGYRDGLRAANGALLAHE